MAIRKEITISNGVVLNYHRITSLNIITNCANIINVSSYTSEEKRKEEQDAVENAEPMNVYIESAIIEHPYDANMNIIEAYEYIKSLPEFEGAEDVLEDGQSEEINQVLNA